MNKKGSISDKYETAKRKRQQHVDAVVQSASDKKIVVAGPGTGKTYLFKMILKGKNKTLTLTLTNALVEDLSLDLCGLSDVKTLHRFARSVFTKVTRKSVKIFPKLSHVIEEDAKILVGENIDFDHLFHNRDDENEHIEFYKKRKDYYGYYGFSDIVFAAVKCFELDKCKIPTFGQVVVDEFQDFNKLEVTLIDLLAEKSPILLAGDDDQALYESLKSASAEHIRQRYSGACPEYTPFDLPYCSRCTRVIVDVTNDLITGATQDGYLRSRINKPFQYFDDEEKDRDSKNNPQIIYSQLYSNRIPWFIQREIEKIAGEVRKNFTVLVISPTRVQSRQIVDRLKSWGFRNIQFVEKKETEEPTLLEGLELLLKDKNCSLGWRVVTKTLLEDGDFETLLKDTNKDGAERISDLIPQDKKREVKKMLKNLRAVRDGRETEDEEEFAGLLKSLGVDVYGIARDDLREEIKFCKPSPRQQVVSNLGIRKIPVTATTIQSSKGLAADYVFITHFDDKYFIKHKDKSKVSDQDICNVLVSLTRARSKVFLLSSDTNKKPLFLKWIDRTRIKEIVVKT